MGKSLSFGLIGMNVGALADKAAMVEVAQLAESAGYDSLWTTEHIVLPDPQSPASPFAPELDFIDSLVALSQLAISTESIKLGTGIIVLPQRQPTVLAKALASLDHASNGRLMFGFGVGYLEPEMQACSAPMTRRGVRSDEYLRAMRTLWSGDAVSFDGEFVSFSNVTANPKPVQTDLHTVVGGHSSNAHHRAVSSCHGWYGFNRSPTAAAQDVAALRKAADEIDRPANLGRLEISVTPPPPDQLTPELYADYAAAGVDRLILRTWRQSSKDAILYFVGQHQPAHFT